MLIGGILLGLVLGLLAGGRLRNLAEIQLRWTGLLVAALVLRFATEAALNAGIDIVETLAIARPPATTGAPRHTVAPEPTSREIGRAHV